MARKSTVQGEALDPSDEAMATLAALQAAGPGAMAKVYVSMLEGMGDVGAEVMQFVTDRIAADMETQKEIMQCRTPADLMEVQQSFLKKAFDEYTAETGKLVQMGTEMMHGALGIATGKKG